MAENLVCNVACDTLQFFQKQHDYALLIPVINEGERIKRELVKAKNALVHKCVDIVICDGGSSDNSVNPDMLQAMNVNALLIKKSAGFQGSQLRMGMAFALNKGYKGIVTIDGNDKDSIEDVPSFVAKLQEGFDFVQGSRFIKGGHAFNTPLIRYLALRLIHAPLISFAAHFRYTDTTSAYRAYSKAFLCDTRVLPLRDIFQAYELLAYLSVRAGVLGYKICEIPVTRAYPKHTKTPTKISNIKGNASLLATLFSAVIGRYDP